MPVVCLSVYLSVCLFVSLSIGVYRTPSSISFFPLRNNVGLLSFLMFPFSLSLFLAMCFKLVAIAVKQHINLDFLV